MSKYDSRQILDVKKLESIKMKKEYLEGIRDNILKPELSKQTYKNPLYDSRIKWAKRKIIKKPNNSVYVENIRIKLLQKKHK